MIAPGKLADICRRAATPGNLSDPDSPRDFSPRRGCIWAPALVLALAILIAVGVLFAQHRFPLHTNPALPARPVPAEAR